MSLFRRTLDLRIDLTNHCNLRCVMCHMSYQTREPRCMGDAEFHRITGAMLDRVNVLFLSWGTEPLINRELPAIIRRCAAAGIPQIVLTTNLMALTGDVADAIVGQVHALHVSVDSADPAVFARVRRGGDLDRVVRHIRQIQDLKRARGTRFPAIVFNSVIMAQTLAGLPALVDLARSLGVREINGSELTIPYGYPSKDATGGDRIDLRAQYVDPRDPAASQVLRKAFRHAARRGVFFNYPGRLAGATGVRGLLTRLDHAAKKVRTFTWRARAGLVLGYAQTWAASRRAPCTYPWRQVTVTPDGLVLPCCLWDDEEALGRLNESTLMDVWAGPAYQRLRQQLSSGDPPPRCRSCRAGASKARLGV